MPILRAPKGTLLRPVSTTAADLAGAGATVVCASSSCGQELRVDDPAALRYYTDMITALDMILFRLGVVCGHCGWMNRIETYPLPGDPSHMTPDEAHEGITDELRAGAYRAWVTRQDRSWDEFLACSDVVAWRDSHPEAYAAFAELAGIT